MLALQSNIANFNYMNAFYHKNGELISTQYDDIYFSKENGLAESRYVFIKQNKLPTRWQSVKSFVIGELGFGCGLNFVTTYDAWKKQKKKQPKSHLTYLAIEKFPLNRSMIDNVLSHWPELDYFRQQLTSDYPNHFSPYHTIDFLNDNVTLQLIFMDVNDALTSLIEQKRNHIDAWYLDGFAPNKNPAMWSKNVLQKIADLSHHNTTLSTFTAASSIRRNLEKIGFSVVKKTGFGRKREMITATFNQPTQPNNIKNPWYFLKTKKQSYQSVAIIGAGIAGCATAFSLIKRGISCVLVDKATTAATSASGNMAGICYPLLTQDNNTASQFSQQAFNDLLHRLNILTQLRLEPEWQRTGVLMLAKKPTTQERYQKINQNQLFQRQSLQFLDNKAASAIANMDLLYSGLFIPDGFWINPMSLCNQQLAWCRSTGLLNEFYQTDIKQLVKYNDQWQLINNFGQVTAITDAVIFANGHSAQSLFPKTIYPLETIRGAISYITENEITKNLNTVLCHKGYMTPSINGKHVIGATYDKTNLTATYNAQDQQQNIQQITKLLSTKTIKENNELSGRVAHRLVSQDRLPLIGPLPNINQYLQEYADISHGRSYKTYPPAEYIDGIFINVAHGSRGITQSVLAGEIIASILTNDPLPISSYLFNHLHPARFLIRQLKRREIKNQNSINYQFLM